jgi:hypothetical protein
MTTKNVGIVFRGFTQLSQQEQSEFIELLNAYQSGTEFRKRELRENVLGTVTKMQTGPHSPGCVCCGR